MIECRLCGIDTSLYCLNWLLEPLWCELREYFLCACFESPYSSICASVCELLWLRLLSMVLFMLIWEMMGETLDTSPEVSGNLAEPAKSLGA